MASEFKAGDVVQLKSGGPKMTVTSIKDLNGATRVWCQWFFGEMNSSDSFPPQALKMAAQTGPAVAVVSPKMTVCS